MLNGMGPGCAPWARAHVALDAKLKPAILCTSRCHGYAVDEGEWVGRGCWTWIFNHVGLRTASASAAPARGRACWWRFVRCFPGFNSP